MPVHRTRLTVVYTLLSGLAAALILSACDSTKSPPHATTQAATGPATTTTAPALERFEYAQIHMGMRCRLVVYATNEDVAVAACRAAFARIAEIDRVASDYLLASELNHVCKTATTQPVKVSDDLWALLIEARKISELTGGAFDITVGPYSQLWRKARKEKVLPTQDALATARPLVGYEKVQLDPANRTVRLTVPGMKLDLGGIAKGYAGDGAIATLRAHGITSALFECGGDIVLAGPPPGKPGWSVSIVDPGDTAPRSLDLHDCAVSTSGDTMQFVDIDGVRYSHVVDPRTGVGVTTRAMGTVVAPKGLWSDPLSKCVYLVDEAKRDELLKHFPGTKAYVRRLK
ncbi:MAG: FAD:protein FMN transferase [Phycisphaerae bacterium]